MKLRQRKYATCLIASCVLGVVITFGFLSKDLILEYWHIRKLSSEERVERLLAAEKLGEMKSLRAISDLLEREARDRIERHREPGLELFTRREYPFIDAVVKVGPRAFPRIFEAYKDLEPRDRWVVSKAIRQIRPDVGSVSVFLDVLEDGALKEFHVTAAYAIGKAGSRARGAVPRLIAMLDARDRDTRYSAVMGLRMIRENAEQTVPALLGVLNDNEPRVRAEAVFTLGLLGSEARSAVPALERLSGHEDEDLRNSAAWSLERIQGG